MSDLFAIFLDRYVTSLITGKYPEFNTETFLYTSALICPFVYYFFLWHWPKYWVQFSEFLGFHPSYLMSYFAHAMKLAQFAVILGPGQAHFPSVIGNILNAFLPPQFNVRTYEMVLDTWTLLDLVLIGIGQILNSGVYSALGTVGTYYGCRFGENVPWVTGFPYNIGLPDPQYWGSILTLVGLINFAQLRVYPYYVVVNILSYFFMMWVESKERTAAFKTQKALKKQK